MTRAHWLKQMIRMGISCVPNQLEAYRFCSRQSHRWARVPQGFDIIESQAPGLPGIWISHHDRCSSRVVLYLHGGGYVIGSNRTHMDLACRIARESEAQVFVLEYRLAPEHPYPAALDDSLLAYQALLAQGVRPDRIILAGDSAGGGLAVATLMAIRDRGWPAPAGGVGISPWLDLSCEMSSMSPRHVSDPLLSPARIRVFAEHYAQQADLRDPGLSPLFGEIAGLPPLLLQVGRDEILLDEVLHFGDRLEQAGHWVDVDVWHNMFHVWHLTAAWLPEGARAITRLGEFVQRAIPLGMALHPPLWRDSA